MLSLCELRRAAGVLEKRLNGTRLDRVVQTEDYSLILTFARAPRAETGSHHIVLSCSPDFARISLRANPPPGPPVLPAFAQYLRSRVVRARFGEARILGEDRQAVIRLHGAEGDFQLLLSILGSRSNLYLLDADGILLYSMRPLEETRRELSRGLPWRSPGTALRSAGIDRWADVPDEGYLAEIERSYEQLARSRQFEELSRKISNALKKEAELLARKATNMHEDLNEAIEAEEYKRKGELLKSILHHVRPGAESVTATDYETEQRVVIPLDPHLSPSANIELYFKRYQKEHRGVSLIRDQLENLRRERGAVESLRTRLEELVGRQEPDLQLLEEYASQSRVKKLLARYYPPPKRPLRALKKIAGKKVVSSRLLPKRYKSSGGLEIWVGRSDEGNDYLTTRLAHGKDLFFHLEGSPGSHVILRTEGRINPPPESVLDACELAVHFSRLKDSRQADVHIAPIKNVRKPSGAKPGLVHVSRGKTIYLRRDPARLERVLASRLDD